MSQYTFEDLQYLFPEVLTPAQESAVVLYANEGVIPPADPCLSCEPNLIRRYISRVQVAERDGTLRKIKRKNEVPATVTKPDIAKPEEAVKPKPTRKK